MKVSLRRKDRRGAVLLPTLIIALLVGISVGSLLSLARHQNTMTLRSTTWNSEIPIAEAGIEDAMSHINTRRPSLNVDGWTLSGNKYTKTTPFGSGYYTTTITTSSVPYTITSLGFARVPLQTNFTFRTVVAQAKLGPPGWGFVAKTTVDMNGNPFVDSYDSSNPYYSSNGLYVASKRRDRAGIASVSSLKPAIDTGGGMIYGSVATGPGGTVSGNIGDGAWLTGHSGVQPEHFTDDFNMAIPDVAVPTFTNSGAITSGLLGGILYSYILTAGDYVFDSQVKLTSGAGILVQGNVRIYMKGGLTMSSTAMVGMTVGANAHIDIYLGGDLDLTGQAIVNSSAIPKNCTIYGLPGCKNIKIAGTAACYAAIYAPNADVKITGNSDFYGKIVANSISFQGTADIHHDEALNDGTPDYRVVAWEEL